MLAKVIIFQTAKRVMLGISLTSIVSTSRVVIGGI